MAHPLTDAHIRAQARLRGLTVTAVERLWREMRGYDRSDLDAWLATVVPTVGAAQRASVALTDAYLARMLDRAPLGVSADEIIRANRGDVSPEEVYKRPFVTVWSALGAGTLHEDAIAAGLARATGTAAMDVQMAMRATSNTVQAADDGIYGYERVADAGACQFCLEVDTAFVYSADAMALHDRCGCGLEPVTRETRGQRVGQKGQHGKRVAIRQHGELGPVLTDPAHSFTGPSDL